MFPKQEGPLILVRSAPPREHPVFCNLSSSCSSSFIELGQVGVKSSVVGILPNDRMALVNARKGVKIMLSASVVTCGRSFEVQSISAVAQAAEKCHQ